jgi:hypothetical protein
MLVDENAHLLVARPSVPQVARQRCDPSSTSAIGTDSSSRRSIAARTVAPIRGAAADIAEALLLSRHECETQPCLFRSK